MKKILIEFKPYIIILIVVLLIRSFIATPVRVQGDSMRKNLNDGELLLLFRMAKIERYDIVVMKEKSDDIIKRIYGLPGETIEIKNKKIYINNELIDDSFAYGETLEEMKIELKEDEYFVLGDNRLISKDSRSFGTVKKENIKGQVIFRFFPLTKIKSL